MVCSPVECGKDDILSLSLLEINVICRNVNMRNPACCYGHTEHTSLTKVPLHTSWTNVLPSCVTGLHSATLSLPGFWLVSSTQRSVRSQTVHCFFTSELPTICKIATPPSIFYTKERIMINVLKPHEILSLTIRHWRNQWQGSQNWLVTGLPIPSAPSPPPSLLCHNLFYFTSIT